MVEGYRTSLKQPGNDFATGSSHTRNAVMLGTDAESARIVRFMYCADSSNYQCEGTAVGAENALLYQA
jgi:hypothetical protein